MSRVEQLLTMRLEELARAVTGSGASAESVGRLLELASVATVHAVALDLLSVERADWIWRDAVGRAAPLEQVDVAPARRAA